MILYQRLVMVGFILQGRGIKLEAPGGGGVKVTGIRYSLCDFSGESQGSNNSEIAFIDGRPHAVRFRF